MRGHIIVGVLALTLSPSVGAEWFQLRGGPDRAGHARLDSDAFDVYGRVNLTTAGVDQIDLGGSPGILPTLSGPVVLAWGVDGGACALLGLDSDTYAPLRRTPIDGCLRGKLVGYDPSRDLVLLCSEGNEDSPILMALEGSSGRSTWTIVPARDFQEIANPPGTWTCGGGALDPERDRVLVAFAYDPKIVTGVGGDWVRPDRALSNALAEVGLSNGHVHWTQTVELDDFFPLAVDGMPVPAASIVPQSITMTSTGFVVSGLAQCSPCLLSTTVPLYHAHPFFAWYTADGERMGAILSPATNRSAGPTWGPNGHSGSEWATAMGGRAAALSGHWITIMDPARPEPTLLPTPGAQYWAWYAQTAAPATDGHRWFVPLLNAITSIDGGTDRPVWSWSADNLIIRDVVHARPGLLVLMSGLVHGAGRDVEYPSEVAVLDPNDGSVRQRLPLPMPTNATIPAGRAEVNPPRMIFSAALDDQLLVLDADGHVTRLGPARGERLLRAEPSAAFPAVGGRVTLDLGFAPGPPAYLLLSWGDGPPERLATEATPSHSYESEGNRTVLVTGVYADGSTVTGVVRLAVGGRPMAALEGAALPAGPGARGALLLLAAVGVAGASAVGFLRRRAGNPAPRLSLNPPGQALAPGVNLLGRYEVRSRLGAGGFATTWLAHDRRRSGAVVIKEPHPFLTDDSSSMARFDREARTLSRLDHPRIVRLLSVERLEGRSYLVFEHVSGGSVEDHLRGGPMEWSHAARVASDVLEALGFIHARGIIHRDIKPGNVLLTESGRAKLADFGIAYAPTGSTLGRLTVFDSRLGTLEFMSPEQVDGRPADERSDLYAVGALLYRMVAGRPYADLQGETELEIRRRILQSRPRLPLQGCPASFNRVLMRALEKDPAARHANAQEMRADILGPREGTDAGTGPLGEDPRPPM